MRGGRPWRRMDGRGATLRPPRGASAHRDRRRVSSQAVFRQSAGALAGDPRDARDHPQRRIGRGRRPGARLGRPPRRCRGGDRAAARFRAGFTRPTDPAAEPLPAHRPLCRAGDAVTAPHRLPLAEAAALIAARRLSPVELLPSCLDRIAAVEPGSTPSSAWRRCGDGRRQAAEADIARSGPRTPLHGIPVGLKDIIDLDGHPTTCHSKLQIDRIATADAAVIARLRAAGAVFPAKLSTHEFAIGGPAFDLPFPPARNPWNTEHHPGGSSSGSGAAVAARMFPPAIGTDTGGSVRHPACALRPGRAEADLWAGLAPRRLPAVLHARPCRADDPHGAGQRHPAERHRRARPERPGSAAQRRGLYARLHNAAEGLRIGFVRHFHEQDQPARRRSPPRSTPPPRCWRRGRQRQHRDAAAARRIRRRQPRHHAAGGDRHP